MAREPLRFVWAHNAALTSHVFGASHAANPGFSLAFFITLEVSCLRASLRRAGSLLWVRIRCWLRSDFESSGSCRGSILGQWGVMKGDVLRDSVLETRKETSYMKSRAKP